ncbi:MAG: DNA adenine methylase [Gemmatimonadota bacterium]|nr:DNA adenine methylase [Gemmatimonadota bacterium]
MRYIGNKTKLLPFIADRLKTCGITSGRALDAFAGTAAVGSFLKGQGFAVQACDVMTYSYVFQRAYLEADRYPQFRALRGDRELELARARLDFAERAEERMNGAPAAAKALSGILLFLDTFLDAERGFISREFSAENAESGRMYFTRANAGRIDAIRRRLHEWHAGEHITGDEFHLLLAALIESADSVANTTGVYAAFVKSWQSNARRELRLKVPAVVPRQGARCRAHLANVFDIVEKVGPLDLLYLDPPYNTRQYSGYYHIPELIARGWLEGAVALRGKTGLIPAAADQRSDWSSRARCAPALEALLAKADARHVMLSYNNEGIIPPDAIRRALKAYGRAHTYRCFSRHYTRYRADDRNYTADRTVEYLHYIAK